MDANQVPRADAQEGPSTRRAWMTLVVVIAVNVLWLWAASNGPRWLSQGRASTIPLSVAALAFCIPIVVSGRAVRARHRGAAGPLAVSTVLLCFGILTAVAWFFFWDVH